MNERSAPVNAGENYDVWINSVGEKGDGIARVKGFVLFVPGVSKGDFVRIKVTKVLEKVGFAEVVQKLDKPAGGQPQRSSKYATMTEADIHKMPEQEQTQYEDTEDFGEDE
ncbi:hypothetical protein COV20_04745 [Candidatus Woesearchaeota archaeon CG10_big_fil_rev_8_21_14_0_10_45_16]|nr:MAG: hypothetical protein COV20_04745 [Candidatus Woesearchaeota archaeon CG10_big_fil_rev_8_21_14_0_10_45_16]